MQQPDLLQKLHRLLKNQPEGFNTLTLTTELACSPNDVQNTLDELQKLGAPLEYNGQTRRYLYQLERAQEFELPGISLTATELRSMVTVLSLLQDLNQGLVNNGLEDIQQQIETLMQSKGLNAEELKRRIRILSATKRPTNNHIYQQVSDALFARHQLDIRYVATDQSLSERIISPQTLVYYRDNWYLDAWCHKRQQLRTFMLSRINSATQLNQAAKEFSDQEIQQHFHNSYGIFSGEETHQATITFLPGAAYHVAQQQWHPNEIGQWQGDQYQLTLPYNDPRELLRDLLAYAPNVIINEPESLKHEYRERLKAALQKNL